MKGRSILCHVRVKISDGVRTADGKLGISGVALSTVNPISAMYMPILTPK